MLFLVAPTVSLAQDASEIMIKVNDLLNRAYRTSFRHMKFSMYRYALSNGKLSCVEETRNIRFEVFSAYKPAPRGGIEHKSLDVSVDPVSDNGVTMLSWIYADDDTAFPHLNIPALTQQGQTSGRGVRWQGSGGDVRIGGVDRGLVRRQEDPRLRLQVVRR
jgi:hypothetical protein